MKDLQYWRQWFSQNEKRLRKSFFTFLQFPSISTLLEHKKDVEGCAQWLCSYIQSIGGQSSVIPTPSLPIVYGEFGMKKPGVPTLLIYGHYDVQPVDPIEEWLSKPFVPECRDGKIYARGASDNKGQIFYCLTALEAWIQEKGDLPFQVKFCFDGEEENGSQGLFSQIPQLKDKLECDYLFVADFGIPAEDCPAITLGARGISSLELSLTSSSSDLHSGLYGGIVYNPLRALVELLASFWDEKGKVSIPGFYEDVQEVPVEEKASYDLDFNEEFYRKTFGIKAFKGEGGYTLRESNWLRPTLEINGIGGGYFGPGFKSVIPATVCAKLSCRLVPNQDPSRIEEIITHYLKKKAPQGMDLQVTYHHGGKPIRSSSHSSLVKMVSSVYEEVFHKPCKKILSGGSVPISGELMKALHCEVVFMGVGLEENRIHAPNEYFSWSQMEKGFLIIVRFMEHLEKMRLS